MGSAGGTAGGMGLKEIEKLLATLLITGWQFAAKEHAIILVSKKNTFVFMCNILRLQKVLFL